MPPQPKHAPTLEVDQWPKPDGLVCIRDSKTQQRVASQVTPEMAHIIVQAVNAHEEAMDLINEVRFQSQCTVEQEKRIDLLFKKVGIRYD